MLHVKTCKILGMLKAGLSNATNFLLNNQAGIFAVEDSLWILFTEMEK